MIINKYVVKEGSQIPFYVTKQKSVNAKISDTGIPILVQFGEKKPQMVGIDVVDLQQQLKALGYPLKPLPGNMSSEKLTEIFRLREEFFSTFHNDLRQIGQERWVLSRWKLGLGRCKVVNLGSLIDSQEWNPQQGNRAIYNPSEKRFEKNLLREINYLEKCRESRYIFNPIEIHTWKGMQTYLGDLYDCDALAGFRKDSIYKFDDEIRMSVARQVAEGLAYVHSKLIIHNDVKPHNIFLQISNDGTVKAVLADFGMAKQLKSREERSVWCSPIGFLSPEGYNSRASDLWALGITVRIIYTGSKSCWRKGRDVEGFKTWIRAISQEEFNEQPENKPIFEEGVNECRKALQIAMKMTLLIDPTKRANAEEIAEELFMVRIS